MITQSRNIAASHSALASTGILTLRPGSINTVPGTVQFSLDIRAAEDDRLMKLEEDLKRVFSTVADGYPVGEGVTAEAQAQGLPCKISWRSETPSKAVKFHDDCIRCVRETTRELFGDDASQTMTSGAGIHTPNHHVLFWALKTMMLILSLSVQATTVSLRVNESLLR